jgi:hypothetical protein
LLKALEEAIDLYQETLRLKQARETKMAELQALGEQGGVKGMRAKVPWPAPYLMAHKLQGLTYVFVVG